MADKRVFGELSDREVAQRAATCGVERDDALRNQAGLQDLPPKDASCLRAVKTDDPTANTSTLDRLAGAAKRAFSAVNTEIKEGFVAVVVTPVVEAVREVGGPIVTLGARRAEGPANYDTPKPPGR